MYEIEFYENANGKSDIWEFLENLKVKSKTSKDARIQFKQISLYIQLLQENGTRLPENITKHLEGDIWELRPGSNRVFYFYYKHNTFVLLHHFRKKTQKTPRKELNKAKVERDDYLLRRGLNSMKTWDDFKEYVKATDPEGKRDMEEIENLATIVSAMIEQRNALGISQRELAALCGIPQSSVARIESFKTMPHLDTLLKIMRPLGLKLTVSPMK